MRPRQAAPLPFVVHHDGEFAAAVVDLAHVAGHARRSAPRDRAVFADRQRDQRHVAVVVDLGEARDHLGRQRLDRMQEAPLPGFFGDRRSKNATSMLRVVGLDRPQQDLRPRRLRRARRPAVRRWRARSARLSATIFSTRTDRDGSPGAGSGCRAADSRGPAGSARPAPARRRASASSGIDVHALRSPESGTPAPKPRPARRRSPRWLAGGMCR